MQNIYVARSVKIGKWGSDVGLGKQIYKVGVCDGDPKAVAAAGWAGETDWSIVKAEPVDDLDEDQAIDRLANKERMIDPNLYPKLKGARGVFRLNEVKVENHILVSRALTGESELKVVKLKPADYAAYLLQNARG
ncbi:MAG TPA: hypothetical protein VG308_07500 [Stellaceae bacterium]|jgi:hypothetical protein|nr:hypothetical protein [Stellaceae bacterium]